MTERIGLIATVSTTYNKPFRPLNRPERYSADEGAHPGIRAQAAEQLHQALAHLERHLNGRQWLVDERYSIADAYLGVFAGWLPRLGERFRARPALAAEGLL